MRISYFVPRCTPENSHGRYVIELAKQLHGEYPVTVYAGAFWPPLRSMVRWRFLPVPNRPTVARLAALWATSIATARHGPADIVHVQGADAPVGNVVTAQFCNAVVRAADRDEPALHRRFNYALGAAAERYCMSKRSTRRIIAISRQVKEDIEREYGVDPQKVVIIPHGVDEGSFHPSQRAAWRAPVRARLGLGAEEFAVIFVGGDYRRKGFKPLLEAIRRVPAALKVIAVGLELNAELNRLVQQNGLNGRVMFMGSISDVAPLYAAADCFVLPTRYDTFSMATLEAMACGLPVIVSRAAGVTELLTPDRDCFVLEDPDNVDALAQRLLQLVQNPGLQASIGEAARKTAERYSWREIARRTLAVYHEILVDSE